MHWLYASINNTTELIIKKMVSNRWKLYCNHVKVLSKGVVADTEVKQFTREKS